MGGGSGPVLCGRSVRSGVGASPRSWFAGICGKFEEAAGQGRGQDGNTGQWWQAEILWLPGSESLSRHFGGPGVLVPEVHHGPMLQEEARRHQGGPCLLVGVFVDKKTPGGYAFTPASIADEEDFGAHPGGSTPFQICPAEAGFGRASAAPLRVLGQGPAAAGRSVVIWSVVLSNQERPQEELRHALQGGL